MDRHLYTQATADGMMELPVFFGRVQGPNMWGRAVQLANGGVIGMTGRRRSAIANYVLFYGDHTLGTSVDPQLESYRILDQEVFEQIHDFPTGYCTPADGTNCTIDRYSADPSYFPDGRALIAHQPERTYVLQGEDLYLAYSQGSSEEERIESLRAYVPKRLGIALVDHHGTVEPLLDPPPGRALRFPGWVGRREGPRVQPGLSDETKT
jgi:hypothetical protein